MTPPELKLIREAAARIKPFAHKTPVLTSRAIDSITDRSIFFKCENFQKVGAFKFRGACNTVMSLSDEEAAAGVATHSSGNHAAALALAARLRGIRAFVVMPRNAPEVKKRAVAAYDAEITFCESTLTSREQTLESILAQRNPCVIHPYNDHRIIAGQGTAALELLEAVPDLDVVIAPVGGGGLLSGTAISTSSLSPETKIFGAEPKGADDAQRSLRSGTIVPSEDPKTIADGLLTSLGTLTFPIIRRHVTDILTVKEETIVAAMRFVWERMKILIEPSAAVPLAVLLEDQLSAKLKRIGIIVSGGNADLDHLPWNTANPDS